MQLKIFTIAFKLDENISLPYLCLTPVQNKSYITRSVLKIDSNIVKSAIDLPKLYE